MCEFKPFEIKANKTSLVQAPYTCRAFEKGDDVLRIKHTHFNNTGGLDIKQLKEASHIDVIGRHEPLKSFKNLGYDRANKAVYVAVTPITED